MFHFGSAGLPHFQIDPDQRPIFKLMQPINETWVEVGYVWAVGKSRTNSTEHWYLYSATPDGSAGRLAPYTWAGVDGTGRIAGISLRLDPTTAPADATPDTLKDYLEKQLGVSVTYVRGDMSKG